MPAPPTINVPPGTIVPATTPVPTKPIPSPVATSAGPPTKPVPTATFSLTDPPPATATVAVPTGVPTGVPTVGLPPAGPPPVMVGETPTPMCLIANPCYYSVVLPTVDEQQGGAIAGTLIVYVLVLFFVRASVRLPLTVLAVAAVVLYLVTLQDIYLYGWIMLAFLLGGLSNILRLFGVTE